MSNSQNGPEQILCPSHNQYPLENLSDEKKKIAAIFNAYTNYVHDKKMPALSLLTDGSSEHRQVQ